MFRLPIHQRRPIITASVLACFIVPTAAPAVAAAADKPSAELDGLWKIVSVEIDGNVRQLDDDLRWLIKDSKVVYGDEPLAALTSYPTSTPKGIDLSFLEPKQDYEGIYALENGELRLCLNVRTTGAKERPFDFSTKDKPNWRIFTLERLPADAGPGGIRGYVGMALAAEDDGQNVVINMVLEKSPAEKAGLRAGDVILSIGNQTVRDLQTTVDAVRRETPGSELKIRVRREGNEKEIAVKVALFPFSLFGLLG
jgi:uncharacterized protein (TIGR03067 family)